MGLEAVAVVVVVVVEVKVGAVIKLPGKRSGGVAGWGDGDTVWEVELSDPGEPEWAPEAKQAARSLSLVLVVAPEPVVVVLLLALARARVAEDADAVGDPRLESWLLSSGLWNHLKALRMLGLGAGCEMF